MRTTILRACTVLAASCCLILGARSQTVTAPTPAQPIAPQVPAVPTTSPAAPAPARYGFAMQGATWRLPGSGALPALSVTVAPFATVMDSAGHPIVKRPQKVAFTIIRRPDANSTDLKAILNKGWLFTTTITFYDASGKAIETVSYGNSVLKSLTDIFDAQGQLAERLDFEYLLP